MGATSGTGTANTSWAPEFIPVLCVWGGGSKEPTEIASSALFLIHYLQFDTNGRLSATFYDKRDYFNFAIFSKPWYILGIYISELICYILAC